MLPCIASLLLFPQPSTDEHVERIVVEGVAVKDVQEGEGVLITGPLGLVRKTVFSTVSNEEDGCCLNFTDGDSFWMPSRDYEIAWVLAAAVPHPSTDEQEATDNPTEGETMGAERERLVRRVVEQSPPWRYGLSEEEDEAFVKGLELGVRQALDAQAFAAVKGNEEHMTSERPVAAAVPLDGEREPAMVEKAEREGVGNASLRRLTQREFERLGEPTDAEVEAAAKAMWLSRSPHHCWPPQEPTVQVVLFAEAHEALSAARKAGGA